MRPTTHGAATQRMLSTQLLRYAMVGLLNTGAGYACILVLRYVFAWHDLAANAGGYVVGACVSYFLNHRLTFRSERAHAHAIPWFVFAITVCYGLNAIVLLVALRWLHLPSFAAQGCAMLAYSTALFLLGRTLVFGNSAKTP